MSCSQRSNFFAMIRESFGLPGEDVSTSQQPPGFIQKRVYGGHVPCPGALAATAHMQHFSTAHLQPFATRI